MVAHFFQHGRQKIKTESTFTITDFIQTTYHVVTVTYPSVDVDPYAREQDLSLSNTVLAFAGNIQQTRKSSYATDDPGRLLEADAIENGRRTLFSGDTEFKLLAFCMLPTLIIVYCIVVVRFAHGGGGVARYVRWWVADDS